jgi:hypothetical protein
MVPRSKLSYLNSSASIDSWRGLSCFAFPVWAFSLFPAFSHSTTLDFVMFRTKMLAEGPHTLVSLAWRSSPAAAVVSGIDRSLVPSLLCPHPARPFGNIRVFCLLLDVASHGRIPIDHITITQGVHVGNVACDLD